MTMKYRPLFQKIVAYFFIIAIVVSCNQYNTIPYSKSSTPNVENLVKDESGKLNSDNILIHSGGKMFQITDAVVENNQLTGKVTEFLINEETQYSASNSQNYSESKKVDTKLYSHFIDKSNSIEEGDEVRVSINEKTGAVTLSKKVGTFWKVLGTVLLVIAGLFVGMIILLLIACNCPHAYVYDGEDYQYTNTLFTGAIASNLERHDYKIIKDFRTKSDSYEMIVKNEENESHYINMLDLMVVSHAKNIEIAPDQNGEIHSYLNPINAREVKDERGKDLSKLLSTRDDLAYSFDSESKDNMVKAYATFDKPADVSNAKVILKIKNTKWGAIVYKTFAAMMGDKYDGWVNKNSQRSFEEARNDMKVAGIPFIVSIKKDNKWVDVETINLVGEVSYNTLIATIDQKLITGDKIELRLKSGYKFWDLDYIGMDFSQDTGFETEIIRPSTTTDNNGELASIKNDDSNYLEHLNKGDSTYFKFENISTSTISRTLILHSKGYYLSKEVYAGDPHWGKLLKMRAPGGLSKLSKQLYDTYNSLAMIPETSL